MTNHQSNGDAMSMLPPKGRMEWNFNTIVLAGTTAVGLLGTVFGWGIIYNKMTTNDEKAVMAVADVRQALTAAGLSSEKRAVEVNSRFSLIEQKIPQFDVIALQIQRLTELSAQNAKAIDATNERLTRIVESQSGKLDKIVSGLSDLTTEVRVIQSQIKDQGRTDRTRFTTPAFRP